MRNTVMPTSTNHSTSGRSGGGYYSWLRLRGLPFDATPTDVCEFFGFGFGVRDSDVILEKQGNRPSGQAYVRLPQCDNVHDTIAKFHKSMMGTRYIEVFESSADEVKRRQG